VTYLSLFSYWTLEGCFSNGRTGVSEAYETLTDYYFTVFPLPKPYLFTKWVFECVQVNEPFFENTVKLKQLDADEQLREEQRDKALPNSIPIQGIRLFKIKW